MTKKSKLPLNYQMKTLDIEKQVAESMEREKKINISQITNYKTYSDTWYAVRTLHRRGKTQQEILKEISFLESQYPAAFPLMKRAADDYFKTPHASPRPMSQYRFPWSD